MLSSCDLAHFIFADEDFIFLLKISKKIWRTP